MLIRRFQAMSRLQKQLIAVAMDFAVLYFAIWCAVALRFETLTPDTALYARHLAIAPLLAIPIFMVLGLYRAVVRFMEDRVVFVVVGGMTLSVVLLAATMVFTHTPVVSRGVLVIYWLLGIGYVGATRFLARSYLLRAEREQDARKRVAIYDAGRVGTQLAYALRAGRDYLPVIFFDDDPAVQNTEVAGLRVHATDEMAAVLVGNNIDELLLTVPTTTRARRAEIIDRLERLHCKVKLVPGMSDVMSGNIAFDSIREVEIEDLLGRESVEPDAALLGRNITGKVVLVSGAGGSIGSELCRHIVGLRPSRLVLMDISEFALYSVEQELNALCARDHLPVEVFPFLGSTLNRSQNELLMKGFGVQTVYHAAAYKHVPMVEHNPIEGLKNNALGTQHLAEAALASGVGTFVLVSTDKAVRPTNVMGASKRLAELIVLALARRGGATRFCIVRFGNVLGSSGSVVPLFRKQIASGGPISLTHPEITRYFMTIAEAAQLVIQAGSMGNGGEVYVLDMGKPVRILDLARRMVHLSGLEVRDEQHPDGDIAIEIVGLRPGEKLYEELLIGDNVEGTWHPRIMRAYEHELPWDILSARLKQLELACQVFDHEKVLALLGVVVEEYAPSPHDGEKLLWHTMKRSDKGESPVH